MAIALNHFFTGKRNYCLYYHYFSEIKY